MFAESVKEDSQQLFDELQALVDARNELVHHLIVMPGIDFLSEEGRRRVAEHLDVQFERAQRFKDLTLPIYHIVQDALERMHKEN